jgi:hypothetical protein
MVARYAVGIGLRLRNAIASPLTGPAGNREFFLELEVPAGYAAAESAAPSVAEVAAVELAPEWLMKFGELAGA